MTHTKREEWLIGQLQMAKNLFDEQVQIEKNLSRSAGSPPDSLGRDSRGAQAVAGGGQCTSRPARRETEMIESPYTHFTAILANEMPLIALQEPVQHRRVTIALTTEQSEALEPRCVGTSQGRAIHESVSLCFLERQEE